MDYICTFYVLCGNRENDNACLCARDDVGWKARGMYDYVGHYDLDPNTIILNPNLIKVSWGLGMNYIKLFHPYEKVIKTQNSKVLVGNHTSNLHMMG